MQETEAAVQLLKQWMYQKGGERTDYVSGFLHKVDDFDLEQYIRAIHFDSLRVPKVPFYTSGVKALLRAFRDAGWRTGFSEAYGAGKVDGAGVSVQ